VGDDRVNSQDDLNDAEYKRGFKEGYDLVMRDPRRAYAWERDVYRKATNPTWYEMGMADVIAEYRMARAMRNPLTAREYADAKSYATELDRAGGRLDAGGYEMQAAGSYGRATGVRDAMWRYGGALPRQGADQNPKYTRYGTAAGAVSPREGYEMIARVDHKGVSRVYPADHVFVQDAIRATPFRNPARYAIVKGGKYLTMTFSPGGAQQFRWWWGPPALAYSWGSVAEAADAYYKVLEDPSQKVGGGGSPQPLTNPPRSRKARKSRKARSPQLTGKRAVAAINKRAKWIEQTAWDMYDASGRVSVTGVYHQIKKPLGLSFAYDFDAGAAIKEVLSRAGWKLGGR
jgi:hypothetical protein